jgi:3-isopropylmalate/(R)-2-methylmalate dehydratase small subunit
MFSGTVLFLNRDDINTDEIIPARYLNEISRNDLKPHLFEDLDLEGFSAEQIEQAGAVVTRSNFGCGSSREHAPWALDSNGIRTVVASGFARIFRQNMFNCGLLPVELGSEEIEELFGVFSGRDTACTADPGAGTVVFTADGIQREYTFSLSPFHRDMISAGGWIAYADAQY